MSFAELFVISLGLSMDAFAVSICTGLSFRQLTFKKALTVGLYFGIFQAVMPLIGYTLGAQFAQRIEAIDHWIAFILLGIVGANMIREAIKSPDCESGCDVSGGEASLKFKDMLPLAVATSIDALVVGVTFAFLDVGIFSAVSVIGIITLIMSMVGVKIGNVFGSKFKAKAELSGGVILILMGAKVLLEHTGVL